MRRVLLAVLLLLAALAAFVRVAGSGALGERWHAGDPVARPRAAQRVAAEASAQSRAAVAAGVLDAKQILFGDLHVHTTYSPDAFMMALSSSGGDGAHPVDDACDFARFCSALDFWSINDHDVGLTPWQWEETIASMRQCDAVGGSGAAPDTVAFLGWEWTQIGTTPDNHYGHKNVVIRGLGEGEIPARPIAASTVQLVSEDAADAVANPWLLGLLGLFKPGRESLDFIRFWSELNVEACPEGVPVRELPKDCRESVADPAGLFAKLDEWGFDSIVIPHGTTWGMYTPAGSAWDKQRGAQHDPKRQTLIEVFSGHGNSEEFRDFREVAIAADGTKTCPAPAGAFTPSCWRAGELIAERCAAAGESAAECASRAEEARANYVDADLAGYLTVPGASVSDWLDAGQCPDCFQPAFNYRPRSSVQYIMALRDFENPARPERFAFGFMASSDNHSARPGTGYKEIARDQFTEARLPLAASELLGVAREPAQPAARSVPFDAKAGAYQFFDLRESERSSSFFLNGGLIAAHASGRSRDAIWEAMQRREVYGTSGPRILLWFDLVNAGADGAAAPMGSSLAFGAEPQFRVRAVGSFEQQPGCPDDGAEALGPEQLARLCRGECYHPSEVRRRIARIEVVRIRPQNAPDEPVAPLIEDPWRVLACEPNEAGCAATFSDPDFVSASRDTLYYVRAIEEKSLAVNADLLRCERDGSGKCVRVRPCIGVDPADDCLAETEERAWSSPIFLEHAAGAGPTAFQGPTLTSISGSDPD